MPDTPAVTQAAEWRQRLAAIPVSRPPCPGISSADWPTMKQNALDFLERFGPQANEMGWTAGDLLGVHPTRGTTRVDHAGALMLSGGAVRGITQRAISFAKTTYRRDTPGRPVGIPVWEFKK